MSLSPSSALRSVQRKVRKGRHTNESLGDSTANMEGHGGHQGGGEKRPDDEEAKAAAIGLQDHDGSLGIHKSGYS